MHAFHYEPIGHDEIGSPALRREAAARGNGEAYRITIYSTIEQQLEEPERAFALHFPERGLMGMAWGRDVTWADVRGLTVERAIGTWLNLREEWDRRAVPPTPR